MSTSARDAWSWDARQRLIVTREKSKTHTEMTAKHGITQGRRCQSCDSFIDDSRTKPKCFESIDEFTPMAAAIPWNRNAQACGLWSRDSFE